MNYLVNLAVATGLKIALLKAPTKFSSTKIGLALCYDSSFCGYVILKWYLIKIVCHLEAPCKKN